LVCSIRLFRDNLPSILSACSDCFTGGIFSLHWKITISELEKLKNGPSKILQYLFEDGWIKTTNDLDSHWRTICRQMRCAPRVLFPDILNESFYLILLIYSLVLTLGLAFDGIAIPFQSGPIRSR
jgi:hypothetical protein